MYVYKELIFINILFILRSFGFDNKAISLLLEIRTVLTEQRAGNATGLGHALIPYTRKALMFNDSICNVY